MANRIIYWLIAHRKRRAIAAVCQGLSLGYPLFHYFFLKAGKVGWKAGKACLTLSFDCDYEEDITALPELLDILDECRISASFACVGRWIERFPEIHRSLLDRGHEIVNHTYTHPDNQVLSPEREFNQLTSDEKRFEIEKCHQVCSDILNYEPTGFRTPHFGRLFSGDDYQILKELGYIYSSSTVATETPAGGQPFVTGEGIIEIPVSTCPRHPFSVLDSWHTVSERAPNPMHRGSDDFYRIFKKLIDVAIKTRCYINIYLDPQDVVKIESFISLLKYLAGRKDEIETANYQQVVRIIDRPE